MPNARAVPPLRVFVDDLNPEDFFITRPPLQIDPGAIAAAERIFTTVTSAHPPRRERRKPWRAVKPLPLP